MRERVILDPVTGVRIIPERQTRPTAVTDDSGRAPSPTSAPARRILEVVVRLDGAGPRLPAARLTARRAHALREALHAALAPANVSDDLGFCVRIENVARERESETATAKGRQ
jgi:hypothetical protein